MSQFKFTKDQKNLIDGLLAWYETGDKQHFLFGGFAGTGKTTVSSKLPSVLPAGLNIKYCAPTAKAANVLRNKGIPANTIHSTIYQTETGLDEKTQQIYYSFVLKDSLDADLIIVDEASMISEEIWNDLLSFGIPIVAYGDHYQLPPINDDFNLMDASNLDAKLETICRQAADNEIIKLSMIVRLGGSIPFCSSRDVFKIPRSKFDLNLMPQYDQIITGKNATRVFLNQKYRELYKRPDNPVRGDKMVFLKNNKDKTIFNGQQFVVTKCSNIRNDYSLKFYDLDNLDAGEQQCLASHKLINNPESIGKIKFEKGEYREDMMLVDFSYAVSVHKSQGSQWDKVIFFDDNFGHWNPVLQSRFQYTAVTRAAKKLLIVGW